MEGGDYQVRLVSGAGGITDLAGNPLNGAIDAGYSFPDRSGNSADPAADFVASFTVSTPDTTPASVFRVSRVRDPYNATRFIVRLNDQLLASSVHTADYMLREAGADETFGTDDDTLVALDAVYESIRSKNNSILYLYSRGVVDTGNYRIEADLIDAAGNEVTLRETIAVGGTVSELSLFTDSSLTSTGLTGSYVNSSVTADELDWRVTQTISGTRVDPRIGFFQSDWGTQADVGVTGGDDENWDGFSVQWDGFVQIPEDGIQLLTTSDDSSRFWVDIDRNGVLRYRRTFRQRLGWKPACDDRRDNAATSSRRFIKFAYSIKRRPATRKCTLSGYFPEKSADTSGLIHGPSVTEVSLTPGFLHITEDTSTLDVTFSGNIDPSTLTPDNLSLTFSENSVFHDGNDFFDPRTRTGVIEWNPETLQATLRFATPLALGFYMLNINGDEDGVRGTSGYLLDGEFCR